MKKMLYVAPVIIERDNLDGVGKKILSQCSVFSKYFDLKLIYCTKNKVIEESFGKDKNYVLAKHFKSTRNSVLHEAIKRLNNEYSCCYIRYPKCDPLLLKLLSLCRQYKVKTVVEIPTYPYDKSHVRMLSEFIIKYVDKFFRLFLRFNKPVQILTYSDDDKIFGLDTIKTINGIIFNPNNIVNHSKINTNEIHFIAVSSMYIINGYERLIEGIKDYDGDKKIVFDLVGEGPEIEKYRSLVSDLKLQDSVIFHGKLVGDKLEAIYHKASIGVNSLAIHRQNLKKESTLKSREYVAHGLPFITSSPADALDSASAKKYVFTVPADESIIDLSKVIAWYVSATEDQDFSHKIYEAGKACCDMEVTLKKAIS